MAEPWSRRAGLRPPPLRFRVLSSGLPGYRSCGGRGLRFRRERGVPQRSSSGIFRRGLKVHFEGSCCGRSSGGVLRGLRLRDPRKGFPWKVSAGAPGRMARRHDKRGAPEIPGCPLFLQLGVGGAAVCPSAAPAAGDHVVQRLVESLLVSQLLQREVHPVTPVVSGDGRDVDAFLGRVGVAQLPVGRKPVL